MYENLKIAKSPVKYSKKVDKGSYGTVYRGKYKNQNAIFKVIKFPNRLGEEGFKWECVSTQRAGMEGLGPEVLGVYRKDNLGILIMEECEPIKSNIDHEDIYNLIESLHDIGICHRDISFENIMKKDGNYVLIDFGLSLVFNGSVPKEYRVWDHAYFSNMYSPKYKKYLIEAGKFTKQEIEKYKNVIFQESETVKYFPVDMLRTLGYDRASYYLHNVSQDEVIIIVDGKLEKRFDEEGL